MTILEERIKDLPSKFQNLNFDEKTGLPKLPDGYIFKVDKEFVKHKDGRDFLHHQLGTDEHITIYFVAIHMTWVEKHYKTVIRDAGRNWLGFKMTETVLEPYDEVYTEHHRIASSYLSEYIHAPIGSPQVSDNVERMYKSLKSYGYEPIIYKVKELNEENILYHACDALINWEKRREQELAHKERMKAMLEAETKLLGAYPPKGINYA